MMISIIVPAYNEEKRIGPTLDAYGEFFSNVKKTGKEKFEIIVVLNACKDKTLEIVKEKEKKFREIRHLDFEQSGKGFAVIEGFKAAKGGIIGFVDADMATKPEAFFELIKSLKVEINEYDGIIASRYLKGALVSPKPTFMRRIVSRMFNILIKSMLFINYEDTQCGAKVFKKTAINEIMPYMTMSQWAFDVEILYLLKKKGFKVNEIPTEWSDKKYSKINFLRSGPKMVLAIIRLRIINSPFKGIMKLYDKITWRIRKI